VEISVTFKVSTDGILSVTAMVKDDTSIANEITIKQDKGLLSPDEVAMFQRELAANWQQEAPTEEQVKVMSSLRAYGTIARLDWLRLLLDWWRLLCVCWWLCLRLFVWHGMLGVDVCHEPRALMNAADKLGTQIEQVEGLPESVRDRVRKLVADAVAWCESHGRAHPEDMRRYALALRQRGREIIAQR
jgi:hypothetical protein